MEIFVQRFKVTSRPTPPLGGESKKAPDSTATAKPPLSDSQKSITQNLRTSPQLLREDPNSPNFTLRTEPVEIESFGEEPLEDDTECFEMVSHLNTETPHVEHSLSHSELEALRQPNVDDDWEEVSERGDKPKLGEADDQTTRLIPPLNKSMPGLRDVDKTASRERQDLRDVVANVQKLDSELGLLLDPNHFGTERNLNIPENKGKFFLDPDDGNTGVGPLDPSRGPGAEPGLLENESVVKLNSKPTLKERHVLTSYDEELGRLKNKRKESRQQPGQLPKPQTPIHDGAGTAPILIDETTADALRSTAQQLADWAQDLPVSDPREDMGYTGTAVFKAVQELFGLAEDDETPVERQLENVGKDLAAGKKPKNRTVTWDHFGAKDDVAWDALKSMAFKWGQETTAQTCAQLMGAVLLGGLRYGAAAAVGTPALPVLYGVTTASVLALQAHNGYRTATQIQQGSGFKTLRNGNAYMSKEAVHMALVALPMLMSSLSAIGMAAGLSGQKSPLEATTDAMMRTLVRILSTYIRDGFTQTLSGIGPKMKTISQSGKMPAVGTKEYKELLKAKFWTAAVLRVVGGEGAEGFRFLLEQGKGIGHGEDSSLRGYVMHEIPTAIGAGFSSGIAGLASQFACLVAAAHLQAGVEVTPGGGVEKFCENVRDFSTKTLDAIKKNTYPRAWLSFTADVLNNMVDAVQKGSPAWICLVIVRGAIKALAENRTQIIQRIDDMEKETEKAKDKKGIELTKLPDVRPQSLGNPDTDVDGFVKVDRPNFGDGEGAIERPVLSMMELMEQHLNSMAGQEVTISGGFNECTGTMIETNLLGTHFTIEASLGHDPMAFEALSGKVVTTSSNGTVRYEFPVAEHLRVRPADKQETGKKRLDDKRPAPHGTPSKRAPDLAELRKSVQQRNIQHALELNEALSPIRTDQKRIGGLNISVQAHYLSQADIGKEVTLSKDGITLKGHLLDFDSGANTVDVAGSATDTANMEKLGGTRPSGDNKKVQPTLEEVRVYKLADIEMRISNE